MIANRVVMYDAAPALSGLPDPFGTADAQAAGLTQPVLERLVRNGAVVRVQRGLFRRPPKPVTAGYGDELWLEIRRDHLTRARVALAAHPHHALSHQTAAVLYGWPIGLHPAGLVHLTALAVQPRSRRVADRYLHHSDSIVNDFHVVDDLAVLTAARTVADCLRTMPAPASVATADAAVREGATTQVEVAYMLDSQRRWCGRPRAMQALRLLDSRRETWLESYSFVRLAGCGVEPPVPQVEVFDEEGRFVARVDGMWIADGTCAEADGAGKYLLADEDGTESTGQSAARRVVAERRRERALLDLGLEVVRWDTWEMRHRADAVASRVNAARSRGRLSRFRGHLRVDGRRVDLSEHAVTRESAPKAPRFAR